MADIVLDNLCVYDPRSDVYISGDDKQPLPRQPGCGCDRCFSGRDKLAQEIDRLRKLLWEARPYLNGLGWGMPGVDLPGRIDAALGEEKKDE